MSRGEIHLDPVKKVVHRVSNKPQQPKWAILAILRAVEAPKRLDPTKFRLISPNPYVYIVILAKKKKKFNLTTLLAHSD